MYQTIRQRRIIGILCVLAVIVRVLFCVIFVDLNRDDYWEYGEIAKNIKHGKGYSLWWYDGEKMINTAFRLPLADLNAARQKAGLVDLSLYLRTLVKMWLAGEIKVSEEDVRRHNK